MIRPTAAASCPRSGRSTGGITAGTGDGPPPPGPVARPRSPGRVHPAGRRSAATQAHRHAVPAAVAEAARSRAFPAAQPARIRGAVPGRPEDLLGSYLAGQALNVRRHLQALRDFSRAEFGTGVAAPSEGHIQAVNELLARLRRPLAATVDELTEAAERARRDHDVAGIEAVLALKTRAHDRVRATERVWDFFFELFGQRQGAFGEWLVACDRIALDCYQHVFMHLGNARSIPAPPPFSTCGPGSALRRSAGGSRSAGLGGSSTRFHSCSCRTTGWSTRGPWELCCTK